MDRRKSVCIHESSHWTMGRFLGFPIKGIEINKNKETSETLGITLTGFSGPLPERKEKGTFWRNLEFQRYIQFDAAGLIGEYIFAGQDDFWMMNPKKLLMGSQDCSSLKQYAKEESIEKDEYQTLLESTANYLMLPTTWSFIIFLADRLLKTTGVYTLPDLERLQLSLTKQYDAGEFINWLVKELYSK